MLTSYKDEVEIPVPLVLNGIKKQKQEEIEETISHATAHEIIAFNTLLQAIEWSITALDESNNEHE